jgi:hypothetical protein
MFIENDCSIVLEGKTFSNGGAFIGKRKDNGKLGGILYAYPKEDKVGTWDGKTKFNAFFGNEWTSNMRDKRQSVYFSYDGKKFYGVYYKTNSDIVRVRELK